VGEVDVARVDVAAVLAVARQYQTVAEVLDAAVRVHLSVLTFGGAEAGRLHVARGDAIHTAVDRVVDQLRAWSRACMEIAAALRASADRYAEADASAGRRVG
jgi:Excreted virulence factor EspC, type VII ESX diderm